MNKLLKPFLILLIAYVSVNAQDIHFSQFYNSPLILNPAMTGYMNGTLRLGAIYRNQWRQVTTPFVTTSASFDMPIRKGFGDDDLIGIGAVFFHDQSGTVNLASFAGNVSFAYHKVLGINKTHVLSLGLQLGFMHKRVDLSDAIFSDQLDNTLTPTLPSSDVANIQNINHEQFNLGVSYAVKASSHTNIYLGGAFFNLTQPNQSFVSGSPDDNKLPIRYVGHATVDVQVSEKVHLLPSLLYMNQAKTYNANVGLAMNYEFAKDAEFLFGAYYRALDAVIPTVGMALKGFRLTASYDVNVSNLHQSSNYRGAFEISLLYINPRKKLPYENSIFFCPRF
jgi:type IX secretion system PorP/SprF family membrane protein